MTHWVRFRHRDAIGFGTLTRSEINVHDGETTKTYDSVDKVPAEHKETVRTLLKACETGKGR